MKKAFTMIELIFVIVILGILASVALPKLAATRDDALIASCIADTKTAIDDIISWTTATGKQIYPPYTFTSVDLKEDNTTSITLNYTGSTSAHFATLNYYCGRKRDLTQPPSLLLYVLRFSNPSSARVDAGASHYPITAFNAGETKIYILDPNSSYHLDRLLHTRLKGIGLEGKPIEAGSGKKVVY